jgi:hypothetical protein
MVLEEELLRNRLEVPVVAEELLREVDSLLEDEEKEQVFSWE